MSFRILLVEDDAATRSALAGWLSELGYLVQPVGTMPDGLAALTGNVYDLLITDIRLDGYNGLQLVALRPPTMPAIVLTAYPDTALEAEARRLGAAYLLKPLSPAVLVETIRAKLSAARESAYVPLRRWARRPLRTRLSARIGRSSARILDVSYGGARLELDQPPGAWLPSWSALSVPDVSLSLRVRVVWRKRASPTTWLCGASIPDEHRRLWRGLVDAVS